MPIPKCMPKPDMRNMLLKQIKVNLAGLAVIMVTSYAALRVFLYNPEKKRYRDYYNNLDAEALSDEMAELGLFQSTDASTKVNSEDVARLVKGTDECEIYRKPANVSK